MWKKRLVEEDDENPSKKRKQIAPSYEEEEDDVRRPGLHAHAACAQQTMQTQSAHRAACAEAEK